MECVIETKASMILQFIDGLRGDVQVTFEEGTSAAWLYDLLKPHVSKLVVCNPRKNKSMREGNQNDKIDARRLAELLRLDHLTPVYHGEHGLRTLKEMVRSYLTITKDLARVKSRVKAIYHSWAIPCTGKQVYARRHRAEWSLGTKRGNLAEPLPSRRKPTAAAWCENDAASAECPATPRPGLETHSSADHRRTATVPEERLGKGAAAVLATLGPLGQPEKAMGHESRIEPWWPFDHRSALLVSELTGFVTNKQ
jgi:hypothetical protein